MRIVKTICLLFAVSMLLVNCKDNNKNEIAAVHTADIQIKGTMDAELTAPPFVPAPVGNRPAKKLLVNMEIIEKEVILNKGGRVTS